MPSFLRSPIPPPIFDSDESDAASQQSNDSSSYLSSQFHQHTRLSFSPKLPNQVLPSLSIDFDDSMCDSNSTNDFIEPTPSEISLPLTTTYKKRKRNPEQMSLQTPDQSPCTRRKNLDYAQETTFQSPKIQRRSRYHDESKHLSSSNHSKLVNINPFSPPTHRYHTRLVAKRESPLSSSLRKLIIQRFDREFHHQSFLGSGEFSHVCLCTNRLDGLNYAIKTSKQTLIGTSYEQTAWREICAYAILISHENLVRYYSSWIEPDGRFFIQLEYCNNGSLNDILEKNRQENIYFHEQELKNILHQISDVLTFIHAQDLAHLDIKPENIMLCQYPDKDIVYKLTDLGHVSQISSGSIIEDGDSRYLALEAVQKLHSKQLKLDKCDIFSLGLTLYVCATNYDMPKQGNEWQELRLNICHYLHSIPQCSKEFNDILLQCMCNVDPNQRPSAYEVSFQ
jgi:wee1-like protein kinase